MTTKKTAQLQQVHDRAKDLDWEPTYYAPGHEFQTRFKVPKRTKDPFRHLVRQYASSQREKDERMYGSITDALNRVPNQDLDARWVESLKTTLPVLTALEIGAGRAAGILADSLDNPELKSGNMAQVVDEIRHFNTQMYLQRYWAKHWIDPEPFALGIMLKGKAIGFGPSSNLAEISSIADPISLAVSGQAVAETAYTNIIFTAVTEIAAANGDNVTPTVFLSIQSDEARHMSNGYATLAAAVSEPDNLEMLQMEVDRGLRSVGMTLDGLFGVLYDYSVTNHTRSYAEIWDEWVWEDFIGGYFGRLEPFGLKPPSTGDACRQNARIASHATALLTYGLWPLGIQRLHAPTPRDGEWLESKYPGWHSTYGSFWAAFQETIDPGGGALSASALMDFLPSKGLPPICEVCGNPGLVTPQPFEATGRISQVGGSWYGFCSDYCETTFTSLPEEARRYVTGKNYFQKYDGYSMSEAVIAAGLVRSDGKTLIGQPHQNLDRLWTIDDLRRVDFEIQDPVRLHAEEQARLHPNGMEHK